MWKVTVSDNWWLISIQDGPRAGDILSIGFWLPPQSGPVTQEQIHSGQPIPCGENVVARKITRDEAVAVLASMQVRAEGNDMVANEFTIQPNE